MSDVIVLQDALNRGHFGLMAMATCAGLLDPGVSRVTPP